MRRTALAALLLTAWFPLSATAASVTVRSGETLSDIAYRYGVSIGTLMRINGIRNPDNLQVGRRLQASSDLQVVWITDSINPHQGANTHAVAIGNIRKRLAGSHRHRGSRG